MKKLSYFIFFLLVMSSCSHKITISEDQLPEDKFYYSDAITPYTGKCIILYKNSEKVKEEMHFKNGVLNGIWISYYPTGEMKQKGEYSNGMFHGKWESWSELGGKLYEVYYQKDSLSGKYITWHKTGKVKEKGEFLTNKKVGDWLIYNESGDLILKSNYDIN
jgi:antitoxin component YwqK of YwqJK toxin-antitoxin module